MSYLVLARKYRPSTFSEVVGQEHVTRTLSNAFASGRVHHAFLMTGPRGCGKTTVARIIGKALNCEAMAGKAQSEPCGKCSACVTIGNGSAVDYQEMDGASNRGIDAIRELTEAVRYQPAQLKKKVYVIDEVHMLTTEAFNALLKTLEEPPPHVTFVLATTEPHKLPNTILSRCQRYDFKLVPAQRLAAHLSSVFKQETLKVEAGAVSLLVRESGGSVRDALSLCDQIISYVGDATIKEAHVAEVLGVADRSLTRTLVRALADGDAGTALGAVESAIDRGVDEVQLARAIVRYLRDLSVLQVAPTKTELIDASDEERGELSEEAGRLDRSRVTQMFERMLRCCDELGKSLQPRLVLDCALIDVATVEPLVPLGDLIDRLGDLEARLQGRGASRPAAPSGGGGGARPPSHAPSQRQAPASAPPIQRSAPSSSPASSPSSSSPASSPSSSSSSPSSSPSPASSPSSSPASSSSPPSSPSSSSSPPSSPSSSSPASSPASSSPASSPAVASPSAAPLAPLAQVASAPTPVASPAGDRQTPRDHSAPVSMQPSGPVPKAETVASGSGPAPQTGGLRLPGDEAEALVAWNQVLAQLEERRKFSLLGPFQHARVLSWTAEQLVLGFPVDVHSMGEMAADKDKLEEFKSLLRELGPDMKTLRVSVKLLDQRESAASGARSVLETSQDRSRAERSKREAEAREHPITKHVLQTFGAQIKEIKTDV